MLKGTRSLRPRPRRQAFPPFPRLAFTIREAGGLFGLPVDYPLTRDPVGSPARVEEPAAVTKRGVEPQTVCLYTAEPSLGLFKGGLEPATLLIWSSSVCASRARLFKQAKLSSVQQLLYNHHGQNSHYAMGLASSDLRIWRCSAKQLWRWLQNLFKILKSPWWFSSRLELATDCILRQDALGDLRCVRTTTPANSSRR